MQTPPRRRQPLNTEDVRPPPLRRRNEDRQRRNEDIQRRNEDRQRRYIDALYRADRENVDEMDRADRENVDPKKRPDYKAPSGPESDGLIVNNLKF